MTFLVVVKLFHTKDIFWGISMRNIILYRKNWSTRIFLISLLMFDGKFGQIKHIIYRLALPSALFGIEMFTICWNFHNCIFVCYHIWRHILPWSRFEQFHVDWVPLVNKTCINTIFWKKDDRYTIQKFSRCFVVAKSVISSRVHFEWVLLEIMIESSKLTSS